MPIDVRNNYGLQCVKWKCLKSLREVFDCWGRLEIGRWRGCAFAQVQYVLKHPYVADK